MGKIITKLLFEAKKGDQLHLDTIYQFQGLGEDGDFRWWSSANEDGKPDPDSDGDSIVILRDVKIEIKVTEWE